MVPQYSKKIQGQQGTLFGIVDEMSGSIFSKSLVRNCPVVIGKVLVLKVVLGPGLIQSQSTQVDT